MSGRGEERGLIGGPTDVIRNAAICWMKKGRLLGFAYKLYVSRDQKIFLFAIPRYRSQKPDILSSDKRARAEG